MNYKKIMLLAILCMNANLTHAASFEGYIKYLNQWSDGAIGVQMAAGSIAGAQLDFSGCTYNYAAVIPASTVDSIKNRWFSMILTARATGSEITINASGCDVTGYPKIVEVNLGKWQ